MPITCSPFDIQYKIEGNTVAVYLYCKEIDGKVVSDKRVDSKRVDSKGVGGKTIVVRIPHEPFFYATIENITGVEEQLRKLKVMMGLQEGKITHWTLVEKEFLGQRSRFYKIFTNIPKAVPLISKELEVLGIPCYEKDILFAHRFLRDTGIVPFGTIEVKEQPIRQSVRHDEFRCPVLEASSVHPISSDASPSLKILALDLETYSPTKIMDMVHHPILMAGFSGIDEKGQGWRKVVTWKQFSGHGEEIEVVADEAALLRKAVAIIKEYQPDVLATYNGDGFDLPYLKIRADKFHVPLSLGCDGSSLLVGEDSRIAGIIHLDLHQFIRKIFGKNMKTESYSLDAVAQELLGHRKHPVDIAQLYQVWDQEPEKLGAFCRYNQQDADLTLSLCRKLLPDIIEFSQITGLPAFDVIRMSFSRLVEAYILKRAQEFQALAPNKPSSHHIEQRQEQQYEGGFVYQPTPGVYNDIVVFDFRSLYPSIITSHNIGPESYQCSCCKENVVPGMPEYWFCSKKPGFMPTILNDLIQRRAEIKKQLKGLQQAEKQDLQERALLEARSFAIKLLANSFYGYLGFYGARWYSFPSARATTAYARNYIQETMKKAEEEGFTVLYGDSLTPDRKIFIKDVEGNVQLIAIGEFVDGLLYQKRHHHYTTLAFNGERLVYTPITRVVRHEYDSSRKGAVLTFVTTHGVTKVTPQHSVYRWRDDEVQLADAAVMKLGDFLISLTDVPVQVSYRKGHIFDLAKLHFGPMEPEIFFYTDLLEFPAKKGICPYCGQEVLLSSHVHVKHKDRRVPKANSVSENFPWVGISHAESGKISRHWALTPELAWILGFYSAEGSASDVKTKSGSRKCMISFGSQDLTVIERVKKYFDEVLQANLKVIIDYDKRIQKYMYYYRVQRVSLVALFVYGFGGGKKSMGKKVPSFIYSAEEELRRAFVEGYLEGDGAKKKDKRYFTHFIQCDTNSKELACGLNYLFKSLDHGVTFHGKKIKHVGWKYRRDKPLVSSLRVQSAKKGYGKENFVAARIKEIKQEPYQGPVYDVEVQGHHNFVDAEGLLLVHNTDSLFLLLGQHSQEHARKFMESVNKNLPEQMELDFEGYYPQGLFVALKHAEQGAKKKYALRRDNGELKIIGFETVRGNWSPLAKEVQKDVLRQVLEGKREEALRQVRQVAEQLKKGTIPKERLVMKTKLTRALGQYTAVGPHVMVARMMQERGYPVGPGVVVHYIIARGSGIIRDRAALPEDVPEGKYDADYYIKHQLLPAVESIFAVLGYREILSESKQKGLGEFG